MVNNGSLDVLPLSPCTNGSLGFGSQLLGGSLLRNIESSSTAELVEHTSTEIPEVAEEIKADALTRQEEIAGELCTQEEEMIKETVGNEKTTNSLNAKDVNTENVYNETETLIEATATTTIEDDKHDVMETTIENKGMEEIKAQPEITQVISTPAAEHTQKAVLSNASSEKMASGIPQRPILSGVPTASQARGLSAASLALKKKQAAESAAAAIKAVAVDIPETDSISSRIRMFGGAATTRVGAPRKFNVRDMVQKYKDVDEKSHDEIAHVVKGHNNADPRGICSAYSLSTASRPIRPTPRRKMSHELDENEIRATVSKTLGGMASNSSVSNANKNDDNGKLGVSQESVQSVRSAKSLFETLARNEATASQR
ncbi:hypothetical protein FBU30_008065 [Linnemannia zychae]|nr:hypothetical protein FBU30_008065 [Linnemannia zychae]